MNIWLASKSVRIIDRGFNSPFDNICLTDNKERGDRNFFLKTP
jgi:hypothetical protein